MSRGIWNCRICQPYSNESLRLRSHHTQPLTPPTSLIEKLSQLIWNREKKTKLICPYTSCLYNSPTIISLPQTISLSSQQTIDSLHPNPNDAIQSDLSQSPTIHFRPATRQGSSKSQSQPVSSTTYNTSPSIPSPTSNATTTPEWHRPPQS